MHVIAQMNTSFFFCENTSFFFNQVVMGKVHSLYNINMLSTKTSKMQVKGPSPCSG